ncbi:MAG: hypothetical protein AB1442_09040 [Nitrospirota bacterium]
MKKVRVIVGAFILCLVLSGFSWAGEMGKGGINIQVKKRAVGIVSSIDFESKTIAIKKTVDGKELKMALIYDYATTVTKDNEPKSIAELKPGDDVIVVYVRDGSNILAKSIKIGKE